MHNEEDNNKNGRLWKHLITVNHRSLSLLFGVADDVDTLQGLNKLCYRMKTDAETMVKNIVTKIETLVK